MSQKTIRVDDTVHSQLEDKKKRYDAETFNEVLKHELGIIPDPSELDKLAAYFSPELEEAVKEVVEVIREVDAFNERVEELDSGEYGLVFTDPVSGVDVCCIDFGNNRFDYYHRNTKREWEQAAAGKYNKRGDSIRLGDSGSMTHGTIELDDVKNTVRRTVSGAIQRWRD